MKGEGIFFWLIRFGSEGVLKIVRKRMNYLMRVCRTAPATPGLLKVLRMIRSREGKKLSQGAAWEEGGRSGKEEEIAVEEVGGAVEDIGGAVEEVGGAVEDVGGSVEDVGGAV